MNSQARAGDLVIWPVDRTLNPTAILEIEHLVFTCDIIFAKILNYTPYKQEILIKVCDLEPGPDVKWRPSKTVWKPVKGAIVDIREQRTESIK